MNELITHKETGISITEVEKSTSEPTNQATGNRSNLSGITDQKFTNIRDLLRALAKALNLINPEVEHHHEQTAYFSFFIAREMGYSDEELHTIVYAALLHDVGSIVLERQVSIQEIEKHARRYARIGARMIRDLPGFSKIADVIEHCQTDWIDVLSQIPDGNEVKLRYARYSAIIHLADNVSSVLDPGFEINRRILNQVPRICAAVQANSGTAYLPEAVDALVSLKDREVIWLDAVNNPHFLMFFTGEFHRITLPECAVLTKLMSRIIDYRSSFTAMHSAGVAASAKELARLAGMSPADCLKMEIAGNLHDVGKLVVPREILEKNGKLTNEEFNVIREHTYFTRLVLMDIEGFEQIRDWASFHHEKLNGKGYPFHFDHSQLDLGARIMAVADIFSAVTEDRPYRKGMTRDQVISVLYENVERGAICENIVTLLVEHFDEVDAARARMSHEAGRRYYEQLEKEAS